MLKIVASAVTSCAVALGIITPAVHAQECGQRWVSQATSPGILGSGVSDFEILPDGDLVMAGAFTHVGSLRVGNIARRDALTGAWDAMGVGADGGISGLVRLADGRLVAAGDFQHINAIPAAGMAIFDGTSWSPVTSAPIDLVQSMQVVPDGSVWISGSRRGSGVQGVWRGDLNTWTRMGSTPAGRLHVSATGIIALALPQQRISQPASHVLEWTGSQWNPLGNIQTAGTLCFTSSGELLLSGFDVLSSTRGPADPVTTTARWNGSQWLSVVTTTQPSGWGFAAPWLDGAVVVSNLGSTANFYNGGSLSPFPSLTLSNTFMATIRTGPNEMIFAAQAQTADGPTLTPAKWNNGEFQALVPAAIFNRRPRSVAINPQGRIIVAGDFTRVGTAAAGGVAEGDGTDWQAQPVDVIRFPNKFASSSGLVIASTALLATPFEAVVWTGQQAVPANARPFEVRGELRRSDGSVLFFGSLQEPRSFGFFRWDGQQMVGVFLGVGEVRDAAQLSSGDVIFAGHIAPAGRFSRAWLLSNGQITDISASLPSLTSTELLFGGERIISAGGNVYIAVGRRPSAFVRSTDFFRWNGVTWEPALGSLPKHIEADALSDDGSLVLALGPDNLFGPFKDEPRIWPGLEVVALENNAWRRLGGGPNGFVSSMAILPNNDVVAVGNFTRADDQSAFGFAMWLDGPRCCDSIDINNDGLFPDQRDVDDFIRFFAGGPCPTPSPCESDFNNDGVFPDDRDIADFFTALAGGTCP